jgi:hypothetical protein
MVPGPSKNRERACLAGVDRALIEINVSSPKTARQPGAMGNFLFRCPQTGLNVQHWLADEAGPHEAQCSYETVVCKACTRLHFINRRTGKLLGQDEQPEPRL